MGGNAIHRKIRILKWVLTSLLLISFITLSTALFFHNHNKDGMELNDCATSSVRATPCPVASIASFLFHIKGMQSLLVTFPHTLDFIFIAILTTSIFAGVLLKKLLYNLIRAFMYSLENFFREKCKKRNRALTVFPQIIHFMEWRALHELRAPAHA